MASGVDARAIGFDSTQSLLSEALREYYIWPLLFIVYGVISALFPVVWGVDIATQVILSSVDLIMLSVAITFVLAAAEIDLSIVGTMGVAPFVGTWAITSLGVPAVLAILVVIPAVCVVVGLANAFLVNRLEIDSLIATLGTYFLLVGVLFLLTRGATVSGFGRVYTYLGNQSVFGVQLLIPSVIVLSVVAHLLVSRHPFGQNLLLTGGNEDSANRAGIDTNRVRRNAFILCALFSGAAGFFLSSRLAIISSTFGQGRLLSAIAAPILGGIQLNGGKASIHQAVGGALLLQTINTCLTIAGVSGYYIRLYTGVLIIIAIVIAGLRTYGTSS